jgi:hypothetical protein
VGRVESGGDLGAEAEDVVDRQRTPGEALRERLALDHLEHEVVDLVALHGLLPYVVERADVGMVEGGDALRLALEARAELGVAGELLREDLQRHVAVESGIAGFEDLAHSPRPQLARDLVGAEPG